MKSILAIALFVLTASPVEAEPIRFFDGGTYEGDVRQGKPNGFGMHTSKQGKTYQGQWLNGERNGFGKTIRGTAILYEGSFADNKRSGFGRLTYPNSETYEGEWLAGQMHGFGENVWADGSRYEGYWEFGERSGFGIMTLADGRIWSEKWTNDKPVFYPKQHLNQFNFSEERASIAVKKYKWQNERASLVQQITSFSKKKNSKIQPKRSQQKSDPNKLLPASSGSGFFISDHGYLITNNHVISDCLEIKLRKAGELINAKVIARDKFNDLALLKTNLTNQSTLPISLSNAALLQDIYVAGFPFGKSVSSSVKVTKGIVSSLSGLGDNFSNIQIDAAVQPGNSGGPIIDEYGNAVGVTVAKLDLINIVENYGVVPENTNFGIKATVVRSLLEANSIQLAPPNKNKLSGTELGKRITAGTVHLSCFMTLAEIERVRERKVLFTEFN